MSGRPNILAALCTLMLWPGQATIAQEMTESAPGVLRVGHWVEVKGELLPDGRFEADRLQLVQPERYETLLGTVTGVSDGFFDLVGQRVELSHKTVYRGVTADTLDGARVKLQGYYQGDGRFTSRKIYARNPGREEITGRIDALRETDDGFEARIMNYVVLIEDDEPVRHELVIGRYEISSPRALSVVDRNRDEEDLFGRGLWVNDRLFLAALFEIEGSMEDDFDLNRDRPRKRDDIQASLRTRAVYQPRDHLFAVLELSGTRSLRDDQRDGYEDDSDARLGETYLYLLDPWGNGLSLQVGRMDFDDQREWLYDQNLDGIRGIWQGRGLRAELSYSETLSDGSDIDRAAGNTILYLSNLDQDRHLAGYVVHRDFDLPVPVKRTHYGLRLLGEWLPENESWLELAWMDGSTGGVSQQAWAFDLGTTWQFHPRFSASFGYAVGQGDDRDTATDETFRQTGLQDNNDKFGGVTSFRYYGELMEPELANLEIATLGLGWRRAGLSLDLLWHGYRQNELNRRLVNTELRRRPNGVDRDLGTEIDLVFGWRSRRTWDLEAILAWYRPGDAFDDADSAVMGKIQFRYRY